MKKNLLLLLAIVITFPVLGQYDPDYQDRERKAELYESKITSYSKMKKAGSGLAVGGGALAVVGVGLISSATWETTTNSNGYSSTTTADAEGVAGVVMLTVGIPLMITGIVLNRVGNKKVKSYQERLSRVSFNMGYTPNNKGFALVYKF